jgi:hypothetical protein
MTFENMGDKQSNSGGADKWESLREKLNAEKWPNVYMFKFIVPADNRKVAQVENLFNSKEAQIQMRSSRNGNYVSITAKEVMMSADKVIERYQSASDIEGLISL